jgi:hypothetical protein
MPFIVPLSFRVCAKTLLSITIPRDTIMIMIMPNGDWKDSPNREDNNKELS